MILDDPQIETAGAILALSLIPVLLFIIFYATRSNWTSTTIGRMMMQKAFAIGALLAIVSYIVLVGMPPFGGWLAIAISLYVFVTYWIQFYNLIQIQRGRKDKMLRPLAWWRTKNHSDER